MDRIEDLVRFVREHEADNLDRLLLSASRYPGIDVPFAVDQIKARRQVKEKLPAWYQNDRLVFPAKIAAEQCSSELTALYKQRLVGSDTCLCDLTGGLGIDSYFFSRKVRQVIYVERFPRYCEVAAHNFGVLGAGNIQVVNDDAGRFVDRALGVDVFYIDPARRGEGNRRVFALADCEPDLPRLLPSLLAKAPMIIAKLSPMADIQRTLEWLPGTVSVHVLSVRNECKELLFVIGRERGINDLRIVCVNFRVDGSEESFSFSLGEEREAVVRMRERVLGYLYEPNASLMKAGAFKVVGVRLGLDKLHVNSHLYTADNRLPDFPGRVFKVAEVIPFNHKRVKTLAREILRANITVRNFPLSVSDLRKRTKITEGGDIYLFATTLANEEKVLIRCEKV